jgi:hypothetical protein
MTTAEPSAATDWIDRTGASCTLPTAEKPLRLAEFDALFADDIVATHRVSATESAFTLRTGPEVAARAASLSARETDCCSFFEFTLVVGRQRLELLARVPDARVDVLDALENRANRSIERGLR